MLRRHDELRDAAGGVREHWRLLIDRMLADGAQHARRGAEAARRLIVENGVTYNVYADPQGRDRPWVLDPLPMLLTAAEWQEIERGVAQRARLFEAVLGDLYGPQRLLADGTLPAELAFGHPNFLWPCHGIDPGDQPRLHVYAVDVARCPDGRWWALADRTQAPSGLGYALENRQIVSRIFPDLLSDLRVQPFGAFFTALRENLLRHAPDPRAPLAVVLTPGSFNETYFEHAYLARQLGLPLVEGSDLTVRGEMLFLKTLGGLRRVHSLLRRLDDDFCDPVELRADSALGVPGLLSVVRAGNVVLANAIGSGVLESAAWMGFMPGAAAALLGEALQLPSVATWWCGEKPALDYVLDNLERLVIKPAYPNQRFEPVFGRDLDASARAALARRIAGRPGAYVGQERVAFSQAPVWHNALEAHGARFASRALALRVYALWTTQGYRVMPGGLARIAGDAEDVVSMQRGGGSKDVWVLPDGDAGQGGGDGAASFEPMRVVVRHDELPSRLAENLFWLGRYSERCEQKTRLLRATLGVRANVTLWPSVLDTCRRFIATSRKNAATLQLFEENGALGLSADLQRLQRCAQQARSRLSTENWRAIDVLQRQFNDAAERKLDPHETLDTLLLSLAALCGFALDTMTQDDGWQLLMVGRRLERLQFLAELLRLRLERGAAPAQGELEWLLDIGDSTITYRTRYLTSPSLGPTVDLLVFDETNPRALAYQCRHLQESLDRLAGSLGGTADAAVSAAAAKVERMEWSSIAGDAAAAVRARQRLGLQLGEVAGAAAQLSDRLSLKHFSLIEPAARTVAA